MLDKIIVFFTSLRLTVVCLVMGLVLVFMGTLAQVDLGLYKVQENYFESLFVFWTPRGTDWHIPVWPGGYLLGAVLLVNLLAAHIKRFSFTRKKFGIFLTHAGLILLLVGQFTTQLFQVESFMRLDEGEEKNYSEDGRKNELAVVDVSQPDHDKVVVIPDTMLHSGNEIHHPDLPFSLKISKYFPNSIPDTDASPTGEVIGATEGAGRRLKFKSRATTASMNDENKPAAAVEIVGDKGSVGTWTVSTWLTKHPWTDVLVEELGPQIGGKLIQPQTVTYHDRTYRLALRPVRYYKPYRVRLLDFTHDVYKGTDTPKNFSSRVQLTNPEKAENREILIYMNNPLRYGGETYYQGGFEKGDKTSILQVVRNPVWLTPYLSCTMVGAGLVVQFLSHLIGFARKSSGRNRTGARSRSAAPKRPLEPAVAGLASGSGNAAFRAERKKKSE